MSSNYIVAEDVLTYYFTLISAIQNPSTSEYVFSTLDDFYPYDEEDYNDEMFDFFLKQEKKTLFLMKINFSNNLIPYELDYSLYLKLLEAPKYKKIVNLLKFKKRDQCPICMNGTCMIGCCNEKCVNKTCIKCFIEVGGLSERCYFCRDEIIDDYSLVDWVEDSFFSRICKLHNKLIKKRKKQIKRGAKYLSRKGFNKFQKIN